VPSADAVIVLHDASVELRRAAAAVAPGGVLYIEVDRRTAGGVVWTPARLCRHLRALGLCPVAQYWVVPGFETAKRFIPLHQGRAVEWYLETAYRQFSWARRAVAGMARAWIGANSSRFAPLAPAFSIVAVEPSAVRTGPAILADLQQADIDALAPVALVTSGHDEGSRVVLLPFEGDQNPRVVVKIARVRTFNGNTLLEQATLREIRSVLPPALAATVPAPRGTRLWHGLAVSIETFAHGRTVLASTGRRGAPMTAQIEDLRAVTEWLIRFHQHSARTADGWSGTRVDQWLERAFKQYARTCGADRDVQQLFTMARRDACGLDKTPVPIVLRHDDFGP
jgi:hypothetical protein